jgi:hypothetical protein
MLSNLLIKPLIFAIMNKFISKIIWASLPFAKISKIYTWIHQGIPSLWSKHVDCVLPKAMIIKFKFNIQPWNSSWLAAALLIHANTTNISILNHNHAKVALIWPLIARLVQTTSVSHAQKDSIIIRISTILPPENRRAFVWLIHAALDIAKI